MRLLKKVNVISVVLLMGMTVAIDLAIPPTTAATPDTLMAKSTPRVRRRLKFRVGVRPARRRVGAYARSAGCTDESRITAFVPPPRVEEVGESKGNNSRSPVPVPIETTLSDHPTLWVSLSSISKDTEIQFTLQDEAGRKEFYRRTFLVDRPTGILGIPLPRTVAGLEVGKVYQWQMAVRCDPDKRELDITVGSLIQRITPDQIKPSPGFDPKPLVRELTRASDLDKPALYAALGLWQDAVTSLTALQQKQPNNRELRDDWRSLLTEAQMGEFINTPILGTN